MQPTDSLKPRDLWDRDDHLDFLDGWHEASGIGFKTKRDPARRVAFVDPRTGANLFHSSAGLLASGRSARARHHGVTGI